MDIAARVYNHNWKIDPVIRSLLDTDFYKLLMGQMIWKKHKDVQVTFKVKNRTKNRAPLSSLFSEEQLREQLDHARSLRFTNSELIWLAGNTFYGVDRLFEPGYIDFLRNLQLPEYEIGRDEDGEFTLQFTGPWAAVTFWEIPALSILSELRTRSVMADMSRYELTVLYSNATSKLWKKLRKLSEREVMGIAEMGTRRRHSFLWQERAVEMMTNELGEGLMGTSNPYHAMKQGLEAIGTNAHELPMVYAALARLTGTGPLKDAQYLVLQDWQESYGGRLRVALADTFGTTQFLRGAPDAFPDIKDWSGFREDSKDAFEAANEKIAFWNALGVDPATKLQLFSDGLDTDTIVQLWTTFKDRLRLGFGWGTMVTNDFVGCNPRGNRDLDPLSIVCKPMEISLKGKTQPTVKLSDNFVKATGAPEEIQVYRDVFGNDGMANIPVNV